MRVLFVWFTAIVSVFVVTLGWYIANSVMVSISSQALTDLTGSGLSTLILLQYVSAWWGPIFDVVIILWAIINSQEVDPNSRIYG